MEFEVALSDAKCRQRFLELRIVAGILGDAPRNGLEDLTGTVNVSTAAELDGSPLRPLEVLPWDADDATIQALARAQAVAEAIPEESERIAHLLQRALATAAASRARQARRAQREVPFALVDGDVTLEGFIDLVLETEEGIEIVDWKTDAVPPQAVPRRLQDYLLQAGLYVLGIESATGRPVARITYVFVSPGVEASPGVPSELARQARQQLQGVEV